MSANVSRLFQGTRPDRCGNLSEPKQIYIRKLKNDLFCFYKV
jgi:hypothetical protein